MLKIRLLGENPLNVDKLFRRIKQFGHPFTGIRITEKGLDLLKEYVREVRNVIGYDVPLAVDHFGHICVKETIRFARRD